MMAAAILVNWVRWHRLSATLWLALACAVGPAWAADDFLEPELAFKLSAQPAGADQLALRFDVANGYYLYRDRFKFEAVGADLGDAVLPAGKVKYDETFQKEVETYRGELNVQLPVRRADDKGFELAVTSQGCADAGLCYPPLTRKAQVARLAPGGPWQVTWLDEANTAASSRPGAPSVLADATSGRTPVVTDSGGVPDVPSGGALTDIGAVERILRSGSWWTAIGAFWLMGLLLSFTPCVLPMLPILSSIIAGGAEVSRKRGFMLSVAYALGMAMVYTALGVAAGLAGEGLAAALQKPWVLAAFGLMLAAFSLSMFDVYELRLPHGLATRLDGASRRLPGGRFVGVFLMGGLSALIVSPCVTAPLAGALVFLSQTRDVAFAGTALFALAIGMSVPLLVLGASAGAWLPRSGSWMHAVKRFFGVLLLAVALWIVQPVLPTWSVMSLWGGLLLVTGFMLRPFDPHPHSAAPRVWVQRAAGVAALALGVMQLAGAASGGVDPLQPLGHLAGAAREGGARAAGPDFRPVGSTDELDTLLAHAGRPVMLDFYADWCVSCKEMERFTFSEPEVQARMRGALLLKADVTANSAQHRELLKRFQLFGPPGTIFFDPQGRELTQVRVVGFQDAKAFLATLTAAGL